MKNRPEGRLGVIDQAGTCEGSYHRAEQKNQRPHGAWAYKLVNGHQGRLLSLEGLTLDQAMARILSQYPGLELDYLRPVAPEAGDGRLTR